VDLIQIYIDEDAMDSHLVIALRSRGVMVLTPFEADATGKLDEEQLAFATEHGCVLYTHNISDFCRLHKEWTRTGREHAGMILVPQQRFSVGEQLRRILQISAIVGADRMRSRIEFLSSWG